MKTWNIQSDYNADNNKTSILSGDLAVALGMDKDYKSKVENLKIKNRDKYQVLAYKSGGQREFADIKAEYNAEMVCLYLSTMENDHNYREDTSFGITDIASDIGHTLLLPKAAARKRYVNQDVSKAVTEEIRMVLRQLVIHAHVDAKNLNKKSVLQVCYGEFDDDKGLIFKDIKPLSEFAPGAKGIARGTNHPWIVFVNDNKGLYHMGRTYMKMSDKTLDALVAKLTR